METLKDQLIAKIKATEGKGSVTFAAWASHSSARADESQVVALRVVDLSKFPEQETLAEAVGFKIIEVLDKFQDSFSADDKNKILIAMTRNAYYQRAGKKWVARYRPPDFTRFTSPMFAVDISSLARKEKAHAKQSGTGKTV